MCYPTNKVYMYIIMHRVSYQNTCGIREGTHVVSGREHRWYEGGGFLMCTAER